MKAAVFYGKRDLRISDISMPEIKKDELLVKVAACGICGTDIHIFNGDEGAAKTPSGTVLGHEFSGEVVKIGSEVTAFNPGDRICVDPNKFCGNCSYCKNGISHFCEKMIGIGTTVNGGFEEYVSIPQSQAYKIPETLSFENAAMTEPVSCCLHGIDLCNISCGSTVAVIGCGMIGMIMLQLAKANGAARIIAIEPVKEKREKALELGADFAFDPTAGDLSNAIKKAGIGRISTVIECVGRTSTIEEAINIAGKYSTVMMFGLTAPDDVISVHPFEIFKKEITLKSSFINPCTFERALELISTGKIDLASIGYRVMPLDKLPQIIADPSERIKGKIIISCSEQTEN